MKFFVFINFDFFVTCPLVWLNELRRIVPLPLTSKWDAVEKDYDRDDDDDDDDEGEE